MALCDECGEFEDEVLILCQPQLGGIDQVLLTKCGSTPIVDPSDEVEIGDLISAGDAKIYTNLKVGVDAPSPITVDAGVSCQTDDTINYDRTATMMSVNMDPNNIGPLNSLNSSTGIKFQEALYYECSNDKVQLISGNTPIKIIGGIITPPDDNEKKRFEGTMNWRSTADPLVFDAPADIFT